MAKKPSKKSVPQSDKVLKAGERGSFSCGACNVDLDIILEPSVADDDGATWQPQEVLCCPFCGSDNITRGLL